MGTALFSAKVSLWVKSSTTSVVKQDMDCTYVYEESKVEGQSRVTYRQAGWDYWSGLGRCRRYRGRTRESVPDRPRPFAHKHAGAHANRFPAVERGSYVEEEGQIGGSARQRTTGIKVYHITDARPTPIHDPVVPIKGGIISARGGGEGVESKKISESAGGGVRGV